MEDKEIIRKIGDDEKKHAMMFKQIYYALTGMYIEGKKMEEFKPPVSYLEAIQSAIMGESGAAELYRKIYFAVPGAMFKNMVFEIITDELKHGIRYSCLYAKNK